MRYVGDNVYVGEGKLSIAFFPASSISMSGDFMCGLTVDIGFMIDSSGSSGIYFKDVLNVIGGIVDSFNVSKSNTHVGFVVFSDTARVFTTFHEYYDKNAIKSALQSLPTPSGATRLDFALQLTYRDLFNKPNIIAEKRPKFLFVFTDGVHTSANDIELAVKPFHVMGIKV